MLVNSLARSTVDASSALDWIAPAPSEPGLLSVAPPDAWLLMKPFPEIRVRPSGFWKVAIGSWNTERLVPSSKIARTTPVLLTSTDDRLPSMPPSTFDEIIALSLPNWVMPSMPLSVPIAKLIGTDAALLLHVGWIVLNSEAVEPVRSRLPS